MENPEAGIGQLPHFAIGNLLNGMRPCDFARMHGIDKGLIGVVLVEVGA